METALKGTARQEIVAEASKSKDFRQALAWLRDSMRSNVWKAPANHLPLDRFVARYDSLTRLDGFHALHDWDGKADTVNRDTIAVDVVNFVIDKRGAEPTDRTVLAMALDYYLMYLLALLSLRVWDEGNADDNLDTIDQLLGHLQGPHGSGQRFAANAETLLLIATSHFELQEGAYDRLLDRTRTLNRVHRTALALVHAGSLGGHLRFGFDITYGRDIAAMRDDNGVDYRWLSFALATLMAEYSRMREEGVDGRARAVIVEALLCGLSPDAAAFVDEPPRCLADCAAERTEFGELFQRHKADLLAEFEAHRPSDRAYSPLAFAFNFSHNILKGIVVDALLWGEPWTLTLNDLLTGVHTEPSAAESKKKLATTLVAYARSSPDTIRGRLMPVIVYDPRAGRQAFSFMMRILAGPTTPP